VELELVVGDVELDPVFPVVPELFVELDLVVGDVELDLVVGDVELDLVVGDVELDLVVGDVELDPVLTRIVRLEGLDVIVDPLELAVAIAVSDTFPLLISALVTV
jgi:hypothetical protein